MLGTDMEKPLSSRRKFYPTLRTAVLGTAALALAGFLAFGYFGVQTLFTDTTVTEAGPVFDSGAEASTPETAANETSGNETEQAAVTPEPAAEPEIITAASGVFAPLKDRYEIEGDAVVLTDGSEQRFLRFENFSVTNGPDLNVYLRAADGTFVDLGALKGNVGEQNYEIPTDVDLSVYDTVEIWCVRFSVGFGASTLA